MGPGASADGDKHHNHPSYTGGLGGVGGMKYVVHKQPLSLDRFFIHEVSSTEAVAAKLENAFVLICLNRFQQIVQVHTFQADSEALKVLVRSNLHVQYFQYQPCVTADQCMQCLIHSLFSASGYPSCARLRRCGGEPCRTPSSRGPSRA